MDRVSEIVDPIRVRISPLLRHANGTVVIEPELPAQLGSRLFLKRDSPCVLDEEQFERIPKRPEHIGAVVVVLGSNRQRFLRRRDARGQWRTEEHC